MKKSSVKRLLKLKGKLKPGDMLSKMHVMSESSIKKHEKSESKKKETKETKNLKLGKKEEKSEPKSKGKKTLSKKALI